MNLIRFALAFTIVFVGQGWVLSIHNDAGPDDTSSIADKVEYAARDYRMAVYKAFRTDRPEFDARRATGEKLTNDWKSGGNDSQRGEMLVAWFQQATAAAEKHQATPPLPGSDAEAISKNPSDAAPVILAPQVPPATPPSTVVAKPNLDAPDQSNAPIPPNNVVVMPSVTIPQVSNASAPSSEAPAVNPFDAIAPSAPAQPMQVAAPEIIIPKHIPQQAPAPGEPAKPMSVTVVPFGAMPESQIPHVDQHGRETPAPMSVTVVPFGAMPESELRPMNAPESTAPKNVTVAPFGIMPQDTPPSAPQINNDPAPSHGIDLNPLPAKKFEPRDVQIFNNPLATSPAPKASGKKTDDPSLKALLEQKRNAGIPDQPIGANLDDSELDKKMELLQSLSKTLKLNDQQKEKLADELKPTDDGSKELETQLNLTELSAQIKAYQDNFRSLQAELAKPEILTTDQSESVAESLKSLETSHKQMDLYKAIAPAEVKGALTSLGDPKSTWAMLKGQIEAQRKKLNDDLNLTNAQRQQQLRRLDAVQEIIDGRAK